MGISSRLRDKVRCAERRVLLSTGLIGVALALLAGFIALSRTGGSLQTLSYDIPYLVHGASGTDQVAIVYLEELDGVALDRTKQAALLDKLNDAGARAVVYDLIFDRPSADPEVDLAFASSMLRFRGLDENGDPIPGAARRPVFLACGRETISQTGAVGERLIPPTDVLLGAADDFGLVALVCDDTYVVRELSVGTPDEPSLAWKAAATLGADLPEETRLIPRWINYAEPSAIATFGAADLMRGEAPAFLRDKVVVVGAKPGIVGAALGLDLFSSPFHRFDRRGNRPLLSGVVIQANSLANLMSGNWLTRSSREADNRMIMLAALLAGTCFAWLRPLRSIFAGAVSLALLVAAGIAAVHFREFWFPWTTVAFAQIPVALVWGVGSRYYIERFFRAKLTAEQRMLKEAFEKYLSPQMLRKLTDEGFQMKFGGDKVPCAMMFTDLESFTNMCEKVGDPEKIVEALSDYFERTTCHIFDHEGVVIKFIGDAIFAAWGAPIPDELAPVKAARAAWHLSQNDQLVVEGVNLKTRIGIHFGEVVAGNIGSRRRVDYTMIGDAVNLSARLEGLNKMFGTRILISEEVRVHLGDEFLTRKVGSLKVKGRKEPTVAHELMGPSSDVKPPPWLPVYEGAIAALERDDFESARRLFADADAIRGEGGDGPSRFYLGLMEKGARISGGVYEMTEK